MILRTGWGSSYLGEVCFRGPGCYLGLRCSVVGLLSAALERQFAVSDWRFVGSDWPSSDWGLQPAAWVKPFAVLEKLFAESGSPPVLTRDPQHPAAESART